MQVHLAAKALSQPAYPDSPYLDNLVREPPGWTAWKTSVGNFSLIPHQNGEVYVPISGKVVSQKLLARYDRLAVRAWELRSRAACGVEAWVSKIPGILHLAQITSREDDEEDPTTFYVFFYRQQRLLPLPSDELDSFLLDLELPPTLRHLQFTDSMGDLPQKDHEQLQAQEAVRHDAIELLSDQAKLTNIFEQLEDCSISQESRNHLVDRCLMLCRICQREQLAGLRERYNAAMVAIGYAQDPAANAAAAAEGAAQEADSAEAE